jgi:tRNA-splicing ligase RtcB
VASGFLAIAAGKGFDDRVKESEEPAVLDIGTPAGDLYVEAMRLAGEYAYAGRDYVVDEVLDILGTESVFSVHNHHNFAWQEDGVWIVRKGATPLELEPAFIGGSMGDISVIVQGSPDRGNPHENDNHVYGVEDIGALGSAPHGAGRVMSRTKAAGKFRKVKETRTRPDGTEYEFKRRVREGGLIDWPTVKQDLWTRGITVLGAGPDEAPGVYKGLEDVLSHHPNIEILHRLQPVGVVMAGEDVVDPYRD